MSTVLANYFPTQSVLLAEEEEEEKKRVGTAAQSSNNFGSGDDGVSIQKTGYDLSCILVSHFCKPKYQF